MTRIRIDRLDLDLRGVQPGIARAAAEGLGPALARALQGTTTTPVAGGTPPAAIDAGTLRTTAGVTSADLAHQLARHLAVRLPRS